MAIPTIKTDSFSHALRLKAVRSATKELLVSNLRGTSQEEDLTEPCNCGGLGRIRHFRRQTSHGWPANPLPMDPAARRLGRTASDVECAQVFQNSVCNWRCWYCFVPSSLLKGSADHAKWVTTDALVALYEEVKDRPEIIDLSGGQPDLTPEWIPWMMDSLEKRGLADTVYLWSDDNLSNDYFWSCLKSTEIDRIKSYKNYGKVGCFKAFDRRSFAFNTLAEESLFDRQFELFEKSVRLGLDIYGYVTLTLPTANTISLERSRNSLIDCRLSHVYCHCA